MNDSVVNVPNKMIGQFKRLARTATTVAQVRETVIQNAGLSGVWRLPDTSVPSTGNSIFSVSSITCRRVYPTTSPVAYQTPSGTSISKL